MEAIEKKNLLNDEIVMELLELLKQNYMPEEARYTFEQRINIDSQEKV